MVTPFKMNDISETEIATLKGFTDDSLRDFTLVTLTDAGSRMFFPLTVDHVGRTVAVIADGEIRAVPRIVTPVRKQIVLSSGKIEVRVAASGGKK